MKKKILLPLLLLCVGSFAAATGCGGGGDSSSKPGSSATEVVTLNKDSVEIEVYEELTLSAAYDGEGTLVWTVADPTIVSVENGKLVGLKAGTTTVTVTAGSVTDTCTVTVKAPSASKLSLEVAEPNVTLYKNDEKQISATVKYNGKELNVTAEKSYESMNPDIVSVDANGKMTAKAFGKTTITVTYTVDGTDVSASINVSVISGTSVEIEQSSVELNYQGEPVTLTAKAYENGAEKTDATITWTATEGQDVIEINGNVITAKNAGETEVTATYVDGEGQPQTDTITVTVSPISVDSEKTITTCYDEKGDKYALNLADLGITGDVQNAYLEKDGLKAPIPYEGGKLDFSVISAGNGDLYLQTRNITYKVALVLSAKYYLNNENFIARLAAGSNIQENTYVIEEDITLTADWTNPESFSGTLDGQGHTITGLSVSAKSGLFGTLENATIKNVYVVDALLTGKEAGVFAAKTNGAVTFENVYVSIASKTLFSEYYASEPTSIMISDQDSKGGLLGQSDYAVTVKDSVIYMPEFLAKAHGFVAGFGNGAITVENSTFIGGNGLICGTRDSSEATVTGTSVVCDAVAAHKTYKANWTAEQKAAYEANHPYFELGQSNIADLANYTDAIIVLTSDIEAEGSLSSINFKGVFDGQGHKITITSVATGKGGLFAGLIGSVKNLALEGTLNGLSGLVAYRTSTAYLENVYVKPTYTGNASKDYQGGIACVINVDTVLSMKDVVIEATDFVKTTNGAVVAYGSAKVAADTSYGIYMENCYYIASGEQPMGTRTDTYMSMGNEGAAFFWDIDADHATDDGLTYYSAKAGFDAAVEAGMVTLSDVLKEMIPTDDGDEGEDPVDPNAPISLTNANFAKYFKVEGTITGSYLLTEDITLSSAWTNTATFGGTFDGQGYTITGLNVASGLFGALKDATIKNVSIVDAVLSAKESGVFAATTEGAVTFENVYVSIASKTVFGEYYETEPSAYVISDQYGKGGLLGQSDYAVTVKDSVIYMPEFLAKGHGFVAGSGNGTITVENSTFIGGNGLLCGNKNNATAVSGITDAVAAHKALNQKEATALTYAEKAYQANHPYVELNQDNIADLATCDVNAIVALTSDIEAETSLSEITFKGVFDGQGHKITITTVANERGGLFKGLAGSVKNVAVKGAVSGISGLVTMYVSGVAYLENVYLEPTYTLNSTATRNIQGAVAGRIQNNNSLLMKNVVINIAEFVHDYNGAVIGDSNAKVSANPKYSIQMENCYYIAPSEQPMGNRGTADYMSMGNIGKYFFWDIGDVIDDVTRTEDDGLTYYSAKADFDAAVEAGTVTLSDMLKEMIPTDDDEKPVTPPDEGDGDEGEVPTGPVSLTNDNFAQYFKVEGTITGSYLLTEDITLADAWTNTATFSGTLDGQGYTITGLNVASGLFGALKDATIKNVSIVDAVLSAKESGVFAATTEGAVTFENVYVSIASKTVFGEYYASAPASIMISDQYGKGGLLGQSDYAVTVKDSVIYMPEFLAKGHGFVAGSGNGTITVENSTFIGGNGLLCGNKDNATTVSGITDAVAAHKTYKANWTDMQKAAYEANHPYVELNQDNIADLANYTDAIIVLTSDIEAEASLSSINFKGVFDGQGHKITITSVATGKGGLFAGLIGSVKNLALEGTLNGLSGLVAYRTATAHLENVYVKPTYTGNASKDYQGAIACVINVDTVLSMKNVVIETTNFVKTTNGAVVAYGSAKVSATTSYGIYMENCYYIAPSEQPMGTRTDTYMSMGNEGAAFFWDIDADHATDDGLTYYSAKADFDADVEEGTVTLTDELKALMKD